MNIYLPENLSNEIDMLIYLNRPQFKPFKADKLKYIIHLISTMSLQNKDYLSTEYIPINAQLLQSRIKNYRRYLDYLLYDLKIIETNNHYEPGIVSKGYRLIEKYRTFLIPIKVKDHTLYQSLHRYKRAKEKSVEHIPYLTKWFNEKLQIDIELIKDILKKEYQLKKANPDLWDFDRNTNKYRKPINQYNHALISAQKLNTQDFSLSLDDNVYRFHSVLTNMRSLMRNAVKYDNKKLVSIDIRNSQPYLTIILLTRDFWIITKDKNSFSICFDKPKINKGAQSVIYKSFYKNLDINTNISIINQQSDSVIKLNSKDFYFMLGENPEPIDRRGFSEYINLVLEGELYDYLQEVFAERLGVTFKNRKDAKAAIFQVLFTDNRFIGQKDARLKKIFKEIFSEPYKVFSAVKRKNKETLPVLLQSIESYLMINVIAKRIAKEYPDALILTIHDSITTTEDYVEVVEQIMKEELAKVVGAPPILQKEYWDTDNIYKYIDNLEKEANNKDIHILSKQEEIHSVENQNKLA